jgi:hypothetical protein
MGSGYYFTNPNAYLYALVIGVSKTRHQLLWLSSTDGDLVRGRGCATNSSRLASSTDTSRTLRSSTPGMAGLAVPSRNAYTFAPPPNRHNTNIFTFLCTVR